MQQDLIIITNFSQSDPVQNVIKFQQNVIIISSYVYNCTTCNTIETITHHLVPCSESKQIWGSLQQWIKTNLNINYFLTEYEVILGIPFNNSELKILNFLILLGKFYINKNTRQQIIFD